MVQILAKLQAKIGCEGKIKEAILGFASHVKQEKNTLEYRIFQNQNNPKYFFVLESYVDEDAFRSHAESAAFHRLMGSLAEHMESGLEVLFVNEIARVK